MHSIGPEERLYYTSVVLAFEKALRRICPDAKYLPGYTEDDFPKCYAVGTSSLGIEYGIWSVEVNATADPEIAQTRALNARKIIRPEEAKPSEE